jgi:hypothetical protein
VRGSEGKGREGGVGGGGFDFKGDSHSDVDHPHLNQVLKDGQLIRGLEQSRYRGLAKVGFERLLFQK